MYYVYAIKSKVKNYIYVGITNDLEKRLQQHNKGQNVSTKAYRPYELIYQEIVKDRVEARSREVYLKAVLEKSF
jgi:putative endonuclease